jgi:hypothetical protein
MRDLGIWLGLVAMVAGCGTDRRSSALSAKDSMPSVTLAARSGYVDSAIPIEEALRRFRAQLPRPAGLKGGYPSREKLVRAFARAVETRDTAALRRMVMDRGEFAWLYYPSSPLSRPPYELSAGLMWFQMQGESERGASRLLSERAGHALGYIGHNCAPPRVEGKNRIHSSCELRRVTAARDTLAERLFGLILERDGRYKFVGYANRLD